MKTIFKIATAALALGACKGDDGTSGGVDGPSSSEIRASDVPIDGLSADDVAKFHEGDDLFDLPFRPADGLGPLYVRSACGACHDGASRGPGLAQKMAIVQGDGVTPAADQSALAFGHTIKEGLAAGATTPIEVPDGVANVKVTIRLGPPVLGRGYLEAIADAEIMRMVTEEAARTDGIHGTTNQVVYHSVPNPDASFGAYATNQTYVGRFGVKARNAALDDFTADAFQGDMGLTTPMRPTEPANPDGLTDDERPGVDLDQAHVDKIAFYVRRIAIPKRVGLTDAGAAAFAAAKCDACHVPTLHTRADYPISQLADIDAPVYTDLLLHDLGAALADGMTDESAQSAQFRTAPLIGLRFAKSYLHDGRASSIADAIEAHAGEAAVSVTAYHALSPDDQQALLTYVEAL